MKGVSLTGIDLFAGAGGMSLGAEMAGVNIQLAIELDKYAAETFKANHPKSKVLQGDIRLMSPKTVMSGKTPFILFGGPPCQGYSLSNTRTRSKKNVNNFLFEEYLRFVSELAPNWIVFENVEGFSNFDDGKVVIELHSRLEKMGYKSISKILLASDFGVPQDRKRFFLVANKLGIDFEFPKPMDRKITVEEALFDLPDLKSGDIISELPYKNNERNEYTKFIRSGSKNSTQNFVSKNFEYVIERFTYIKPGQNWTAIPERLMANYSNKENCHSGIYKRLDPQKPSVVISNYRKNMLIHPSSHRGLSVREAARLQSFPDKFLFKGPLSLIQQQIGNAVPPLLAYAVFKQIITAHNATTRKSKRSR